MAILKTNCKAQQVINGHKYTTRLNEDVQLDIKNLNYGDFDADNLSFYSVIPDGTAAAKTLFEFFPPEEWTYRLTFPGGEDVIYGSEILLEKEAECINLYITRYTEEEFEFFRDMSVKMFPDKSFMTLEEFQKDLLENELIDAGSTDSPTGQGLSDLMMDMDEDDFQAVLQMFYNRRQKYTDVSSIEINYDALYGTINQVILEALVEKARREQEET
jgi:hypothetical protein